MRDLGAPLNNVKTKLREIEGSLAGFQHTIDVLVGEIESDKERSDAIEVRSSSSYYEEVLEGSRRFHSLTALTGCYLPSASFVARRFDRLEGAARLDDSPIAYKGQRHPQRVALVRKASSAHETY